MSVDRPIVQLHSNTNRDVKIINATRVNKLSAAEYIVKYSILNLASNR